MANYIRGIVVDASYKALFMYTDILNQADSGQVCIDIDTVHATRCSAECEYT